jgi:hypothetical protein
MNKAVFTLMLISATMQAQVAMRTPSTTTDSANRVAEWNRNLLSIVRTPGAQPGTIQPTRSFAIMSTPPNFPKPQFTEWSQVTPCALLHASQFRPAAPPTLTRGSYTDAFNEVKSLGIIRNTATSVEQALIGRFWNGVIQNYWNDIPQAAIVAHELTTTQSARLFALLNLSFADGVIAFSNAQYVYTVFRPIMARRAADSDNNPDTTADLNWLPEVGNATPDPSYPGPHAVIAGVGATVSDSFFGSNESTFTVTSEVMARVDRHSQHSQRLRKRRS